MTAPINSLSSGGKHPDIAYFKSIPWCAEYLNRPEIVIGMPHTRTSGSRTDDPNHSRPGEDILWATTFNTPDTIPHFVVFYERPREGQTGLITELSSFMSLRHGINGYPDVSHGGVAAAILDEICGLVVPLNIKRGLLPRGTQLMTAYLNTAFKRPVPTGGEILIKASIVRQEGRKYYMEAAIQDQHGNVCAQCETLFIELRPKI